MQYYNRRVYSDYRKDLSDATRHGMRDSEDAIISSYKFAKHYSKHLLEIAHRKNTEYSSVGVLDTNDLVNLVSLCFGEAWERVGWESINKMPEGGAKQAQFCLLYTSPSPRD